MINKKIRKNDGLYNEIFDIINLQLKNNQVQSSFLKSCWFQEFFKLFIGHCIIQKSLLNLRSWRNMIWSKLLLITEIRLMMSFLLILVFNTLFIHINYLKLNIAHWYRLFNLSLLFFGFLNFLFNIILFLLDHLIIILDILLIIVLF